jgi:RecA/RadA recombinase
MTDFFKGLIKDLPAATSMAEDGNSSSEFDGYVDTGSFMLNAAFGGSLFAGLPSNKIAAIAGDPATGKSFFALGILRNWLNTNKTGGVIYFDTESAITNQMLSSQGLDLARVAKSEPETIEQFRKTALAILDRYAEVPVKDRAPMIMVLDSLGNLSSEKEVTDIREEKDTRDMTKASLLRGTFRVLRLRLAKLNVPLLVTNHVYAQIGAYVPTKIISGGSGLIYVSDLVAMLSKTKDRDKEKNVIGSIIKVKMFKSRLSKENSECEVRISYKGGLDRYHGLLEAAEEAGMITGSMGKYTFPGHPKPIKAAVIAADPTTYFTEEFLRKLDTDYIVPNFSYGEDEPVVTEEEDTE